MGERVNLELNPEISGFNHPALLRRELINRKILQRSPDGKVYWKVASIQN